MPAPDPAPRWPLPGELRMPLQIGNSALVEAAIFASGALNTLALALAHLPGGEWGAYLVVVLLCVVTIGWLSVAWSSLVGCRASDMVLGPAGFRVDGGPRHGLLLPWPTIVADRCRVENDRVPDASGSPIRGRQLILTRTDGPDVLAAEAYQVDDRDALYVALDEVRAVHGLAPAPEAERTSKPRAPDVPAAAAVTTVDLLRCDRCGAAAVPADMSHVTCPQCQASVPVPPAARRVLQGEAALAGEQARGQALVADLLDQRGATATNRRLLLAAAVMFAIPVAGGLAYADLHARGLGGPGYTVATWFAVTALVVLVAALAGPMMTRRVALRACLVELGARHDGGPRCRSCGAALPTAAPSLVVVRCPYCRTDNLLGVDLRPFENAEQSRQRTLGELLADRRAALRETTTNIVVCAVIFLLSGTWPLLALLGD